MRLLILFASNFSFQPGRKTLANAPVATAGGQYFDTVLAFIHAESADDEAVPAVVTKLVKNLKWAARKNETDRIILHSFAHLGESRAPPEVAERIITQAERRLRDAGYAAAQTPFGYLLNLQLSAPGRPFARIYREFQGVARGRGECQEDAE